MDFATRKTYFNRCKPDEPLWPSDDRNVDLDQLGTVHVRGVNWTERLASWVELSDEPVCVLFTGLPGSGKSTELRRLAARLSDPDRACLLPVVIDAEQVLDLSNEVDIPEIIAALLHQAEVSVLKEEGRDASDALRDGYLNRLWSWLTRTDVTLTQAEYSIPNGPSLVAEMKTRPTLRERVRQTIAAHLTTFLREARDELSLLKGRAVARGHAGLVVIFDSLEKLRGISSNWEQVLASAERVFGAGAPYLRLPVHVLYTIPPALLNRCKGVEFMPMIKLAERDGTPFAPGVGAAREIIRRRIPDEILAELLGTKCERRLEEVIRWSGGYPREVVRLLQSVIAVRKSPVTDEDLDRIFAEVRDAYRKIVPAEAFDWLAQVAETHYLTIQNDGHRQAADLMIQNSAVLRYLNGGDWFDLHPAVREIPGVEEARRALASQRAVATPGGG
jgi:hypothetical protein